LKFLHAHGLTGANARARFVREARAAAALDHPNICTVHEIGEHEDHAFIVMAFLDGESLGTRIRSGPLELREVVEVAVQIAEGLDHAHQRGIVHRDIKSANVFVLTDGRVKIVDFGLARREDTTSLTDSGARPGTVQYMSPEQARGETVDGRSDVWSLGVLIYEMLTGKRPFASDFDEAVVYRILNTDPEPISDVRGGVPQELERIALKAIAKNPQDRHQRAGELADDLLTLVDDPSSRRRLTSGRVRDAGPLPRWKPRRWIPVAGGLGAAVAAAIAAVLIFYPSESVPFQNRDWILITDFENQTGEEDFEGTIGEALSIDLQQSRYVNVFAGRRLTEALRRMEREDAGVIDAELGRDICVREGIPVMLVGNISKLGNAYAISARMVIPSSGDAVKTERVEAKNADHVLAAVDKLSNKIRRNLGESLISIRRRNEPLSRATTSSMEALRFFTLGDKHLNRGEDEKAIPFFAKAIEADSTFALAHAHLAVVYHNRRETTMAINASKNAMRWREEVSDRERYFIEAEYYRYRSAYAQAVEKYRMLTELYPDNFGGHNNLAFLYQYTRQYQDALTSIVEAERVRPNTWHVIHNRALAYAGMGDYEGAARLMTRAIEVSPQAGWSRICLFWVTLFSGESQGALRHLEFPDEENNWRFLKSESRIYRYFYLGQEQEAIAYLRDQIRGGLGATEGWAEAYYRRMLGEIYLRRRDAELALVELEKAFDARQSVLTAFLLGKAYIENGMDGDVQRLIGELAQTKRTSESYPKKSTVHFLRGEYLLSKGLYDEATIELAKAQDFYDNLAVREALARVSAARGDYEKAIEEYHYIIRHQFATFFERSPLLFPLANYRVAEIYDRIGDVDRAVEHYETFLETQKEGDDDAWRVVTALQRLESLSPKD
jgi:tetratricopeptide (TPR) repeat protein